MVERAYTFTANPYDEGDFMHKQAKAECPKQDEWIKENLQSEKMRLVLQNPIIQQFFRDLGEAISEKVQFQLAAKLIDSYFCLRNLGLPHLQIFDEPHNTPIAQFLNKMDFYGRFLLTKVQVQVCSSLLLDKTIENMQKVIEGSGPKLVLYSCHVTTISCLFTALEMTSFDCIADKFFSKQKKYEEMCLDQYPPFASLIAIELYRQGQENFLKIVYNGVPLRIPVCGNKQLCPFEEFQAFVKGFSPIDPNILCGIDLPTNPLKRIELNPANEQIFQDSSQKKSRRWRVYEDFRLKFSINDQQ